MLNERGEGDDWSSGKPQIRNYSSRYGNTAKSSVTSGPIIATSVDWGAAISEAVASVIAGISSSALTLSAGLASVGLLAAGDTTDHTGPYTVSPTFGGTYTIPDVQSLTRDRYNRDNKGFDGSYTIVFSNDKKYHGKGPINRMIESTILRMALYKITVKSLDWSPAVNEREAFKAEYYRMQTDQTRDYPEGYRNLLITIFVNHQVKHIYNKMDSKIYTDKDNGLFVTTRIEEWERRIKLRISQDLKLQLINISDIDKLQSLNGVAYDMVTNEDFILINNLLNSQVIESLSIHESTIIDLSVISCTHLILGDKVKFDLNNERLNGVERITFLSLKTFKGKIVNDLINVKHLVVWEDNKSVMNELLKRFPNLESLYLVRTNVEYLDISSNPYLKTLELHDCKKLKNVQFGGNIPENIVVEMCRNLSL